VLCNGLIAAVVQWVAFIYQSVLDIVYSWSDVYDF
jgi:hypothetical protein